MSDLATLTFGDFELSPRRRTLTQGGQRVRIGARAMDILLLLAARPGDLVTKDEIQARLWPGIFVDEGSIRVHLSSLRKALGGVGADYIHTVAGRGYILTPTVRRSDGGEADRLPDAPIHLPLRLERLIGRAAVVDSVSTQVQERRFVTIVGPGGIGKTSVALEVAARLADDFPDGVRFVDLASLEDPEAAPGVLAIALGLPPIPDLSAQALARPLAGKRLLVLLDNCERSAEAAASVAEALLRSSPGVCVLATSREALRGHGEWLHRLPPLATPVAAPATPEAALAFSAIELFVDRADAASGGYRLTAEDCGAVAEICTRLDGLPLAIELAAATIATLGVQGIAAGLDDRLTLLTGGRRTAQSRHQTLRAALDWSYDHLGSAEKDALGGLSVIAGGFDLVLACDVAGIPSQPAAEVRKLVGALAGKSLVSVETTTTGVRYRLLESTRAYAAEQVAASAGFGAAMRRYAVATLSYFRGLQAGRTNLGRDAWLVQHAARLDDARAVLEWGYSDLGDTGLAHALTAQLADLWLHLGLIRECVAWCQKALTAPPAPSPTTDADEMRIRHAFRVAFGFKYGNEPSKRAAILETLELARKLDNHDYMMRDLWGLTSLALNEGQLSTALVCARELRDAARGPDAEAERLVADRMTGSALHLMGRHGEAKAILEAVNAAYDSPRHRASSVRFQFDQRVLSQGFLAWIAWLQGDVDAAANTITAAVTEAVAVGHAGSLGFALDSAVTLSVLRGDLEQASGDCRRLGELGASIGYDVWVRRGEILAALIQVRSDDLSQGVPRLRAALSPSAWKLATYRTPFFLAELAQAERKAGFAAEALTTIENAIGWFGGVDDFWCAPECFRIKAEILEQHGGGDARCEAQALLARASRLAEAQGAEAWRARIPSTCN
ncbi:MAG: helix-turn-helix transcriptional regulator [Alphaproteobacteria bacterium]|nr:helix-turn-helix transcriptional regulator [Alphaproteobacteria bacterium]MBU1516634.1 helix-turn-helix transcriptional regulator [Alphaproteobacteria bacterium]MBU2094390.1 helix-turn-helix transcriptional regulator [Alphaproteobacteria bacterium]MBU2153275.1 helix-turn-helix transcriptional regulator [Alphaproteobacteria bacterium]MBU2307561.1 helix-turn-helix transcriptional regulator [Alphaproteobacteria bacterium]